MASTWFAMGLCVCAVLLTGILGDPATELDCPSEFKSGSDNDVTYKVNSVGITTGNCFIASNVIFTYTPDGETSGTQVCSHKYPPDSCNDFTTSDTCGCTKQEGDVYTYKYTFPINIDSLCGKIQASLCQEPSGPFEEDVSPNCNTIRFDDPTLVIVLLTLAQLVFVAASVVANYFYIYRGDFTLFGSGKNIAVFVGLMFAVVMVVICVAVATTFACRNFPKESSCTPVCTACIAPTSINVFVFVGITILIVIIKRPRSVIITSYPCGQSKNSYTLTWIVTGRDCADIKQFSIAYVKVEADTSCDPWKAKKQIGLPVITEADGKERSKTLEPLSANTFYEVTITAITMTGTSEGSPFVFKTAA